MRRFEEKIIGVKAIKPVISRLKKRGKRIVFTNGCFDIIHYGHIFYLEKARLLGDILIVGLNSDASVRRLKGEGRPVNSLRDRMRVLAALESVDYVLSFSQDTPLRLIKQILPDVLVKGGDWPVDKIAGADIVIGAAGQVVTIPLRKGRSTTSLIRKIMSL